MPQITKDFIKKIGEIFKESEKLYETEEKIKLQTQNSATSLAELFIEQIDNEMSRDKKREKQRAIALKDAETEGLPSPNAIGTLQTNGKVTSLQKVLKLYR